ncbi:MAG TPA: glycosyltransferase family 39 protein [Baekduia sp.]|nr:glycosyltransferase family 39 protein [Baekduia sp.]
MSDGFGQTLFAVETGVLAFGLTVAGLAWLLHRLRRTRPEFRIGTAVALGFGARLLAVLAIEAMSPDVRGTDETVFLRDARALADQSLLSSDAVDALTSTLHVWLFSLELRVPEIADLTMRLVQVGIAVTGLVLLAAAVHDLAGPRAGRIAAWVVMLEPSSVFFSGLLHKEPFMVLAAGIVAFGGVQMWQRRDGRAVATMAAGSAVAIMARPYAGALLLVAALAIALHGSLARRGPRQRRSVGTLALVVLLLVAATPTALEQTSDRRLQETLQPSQEANARDASNLRLERVDFSSRTNVILNLPKRMRDVVLRPYPWELGSRNQQLGLPGTLAALAAFALLFQAVLRARGQVLERAGPILYPAAFLFLAFSLSAGNAGTAFRLRSTVVALVICLVVVLRERARTAPVAVLDEPYRPPPIAAAVRMQPI